MNFKILFALFINITIAYALANTTIAQTTALELAKEYQRNGDLQKAIITLKDQLEKDPKDYAVFKQLFDLYLLSDDITAADKELQKFLKKTPENISLIIDQLIILKKKEKGRTYDRKKTKIYNSFLKLDLNARETLKTMTKQSLFDESIDFINYLRKELSSDLAYSVELTEIYRSLERKSELLEEILKQNETGMISMDQMLNILQLDFSSEEDLDFLETKFIEKVQSNTNDFTSTELLVWLYTQKKQFSKALIYEKALDRLFNKRARGLLDLANLAINNQDYEATNEICRTIISIYPSGNEYFYAKKLLLFSSESRLKTAFPIDTAAVQSLIRDYEQFSQQAKGIINPLEIQLSIARLLAFYLGDLDRAEIIISEILNHARIPNQLVAEAKLDLGDVYILKDQHWDASLTYSQVEKIQKDQPLGYEAKFRNARANYFKGEFELAAAHLDILKLATTREIANNAIELSVFIKSHLDEEDENNALRAFAQIELLEFTQKISIALDSINQLLLRYRSHPLNDDLLFKQSKLLRKTGRYYEAVASLDALFKNYPESILADDALFEKASIYHYDLVLIPDAMSTYQELLIQYPGSTLTNESRKRFRLLRGDKIN